MKMAHEVGDNTTKPYVVVWAFESAILYENISFNLNVRAISKVPFEVPQQYLTHTFKDMYFLQMCKFKSS